MSNLQDKINNARNANDELATDAINDIEKQTYYLRTDFDRLTIDKSTRESRREAALKILEKVKNGEIEKVDEDDIYQMHHENDSINDELKENHQDSKNLTSYETKENNNSESDSEKIEQEQEVEFEDLNAIDRLKVISQLVNNSSDTVNQNQNNDNESSNESEDENEDKKNSNKNINEDKFDSSESISVSSNLHEENDSTYNEHNEKKPGIFKRMMNKLFGGNE